MGDAADAAAALLIDLFGEAGCSQEDLIECRVVSAGGAWGGGEAEVEAEGEAEGEAVRRGLEAEPEETLGGGGEEAAACSSPQECVQNHALS